MTDKIDELEGEKLLLWTIIEELETWMFGEGCHISERTKAKIAMARKCYNEPDKKTKQIISEILHKVYQADNAKVADMRKRPRKKTD